MNNLPTHRATRGAYGQCVTGELGDGTSFEAWFTNQAIGTFATGTNLEELNARRALIASAPWTWLRQVHGADVVLVQRAGENAGVDADAAVVNVVDAPIAVGTADCAPVLLWHSDGPVAVVHAGWRGAVAGVLPCAVQRLLDQTTGGVPDEICAVVGPCIAPESYQFSVNDLGILKSEFGDSVIGETTAGDAALDLRAAVCRSLNQAGVSDIQHIVADTAGSDQEYFSHRARRDEGRQVLVAWKQNSTVVT